MKLCVPAQISRAILSFPLCLLQNNSLLRVAGEGQMRRQKTAMSQRPTDVDLNPGSCIGEENLGEVI